MWAVCDGVKRGAALRRDGVGAVRVGLLPPAASVCPSRRPAQGHAPLPRAFCPHAQAQSAASDMAAEYYAIDLESERSRCV